MIKKTIENLVCLFLIAGLSWFGIFGVLQAFAHFNDLETREDSFIGAGILDLTVESGGDFSPQIEPGQSSERVFTAVNSGGIAIGYDILPVINNSGLCGKIMLDVYRNSVLVYSNDLSGFNLFGLNLGASDSDEFRLVASLIGADNSLWGKNCDFNFIFTAVQAEDSGFEDLELLNNNIESGTWDNPPVIEPGDIVINEIMWMGSMDNENSVHSGDEWIELRNLTGHEIYIGKWTIENARPDNKKYMIPASHSIPAYGYFLIANHPEQSKNSDLNVSVDQPNASMEYSDDYGSNGQLILKDADGNMIDVTLLPANSEWTKGINETDKKWSMERNLAPGDGSLPENWHTCDPEIMEAGDLALMRGYWKSDADLYNCGTPGHANLSKNDSSAPDYDSTYNQAEAEVNLLPMAIVEDEAQNDFDSKTEDSGVLGSPENHGIDDSGANTAGAIAAPSGDMPKTDGAVQEQTQAESALTGAGDEGEKNESEKLEVIIKKDEDEENREVESEVIENNADAAVIENNLPEESNQNE